MESEPGALYLFMKSRNSVAWQGRIQLNDKISDYLQSVSGEKL